MPSSDKKGIIVAGSSGGGAANLGHLNPTTLISAVSEQLKAASCKLTAVQFVCSETPLDYAQDDTQAALWLSGLTQVEIVTVLGERWKDKQNVGVDVGVAENLLCVRGSLQDVNAAARRCDAILSYRIVQRKAHGLIVVSGDSRKDGVNGIINVAAEYEVPLVGTGGTSLSWAAERGCRLIGNSGGSVATTTLSKAISFASAFANEFHYPYAPALPLMPSWRAPLSACLPVFIAKALVKWLRGIVPALEVGPSCLEAALGAVSCSHVSGLGEVGVMCGAATGLYGAPSLIAALAGGMFAGRLLPRVLARASAVGVPSTATTILAGGVTGISVGVLVRQFVPYARVATELFRGVVSLCLGGDFVPNYLQEFGGWSALGGRLVRVDIIKSILKDHVWRDLSRWFEGLSGSWVRAWVGSFFGLLFQRGSQVGWYHSYFLPMILIEMEDGGVSHTGAFDLATLCMTGAGACAAQILLPRKVGNGEELVLLMRMRTKNLDFELAWRGLLYNLFAGDFVEAAYPFLKRDRLLQASVDVASCVSGALLATGGGLGTAYLPFPLAIAMCPSGTPRRSLVAACAAAFLIPLCVGLISNAWERRRLWKQQQSAPELFLL